MIKAIETTYKGYRFRSRLEARWAVLFDSAEVEWLYESEGFELPGGISYLPDFYIKGNGHRGPWVELKGQEPTQAEVDKLVALCEAKGSYGLLLWGAPGDEQWLSIHKEGMIQGDSRDGYYTGADLLSALNVRHPYCEDWVYAKAVAAARSARFEFGESGAVA